MGQLQDIQDLIDKVRSAKNAVEVPKSIVRNAQSGTLQYPCLISDSIAVDMASTIAKTMERVYASFIQIYLSTHNTIDISVDKNPNAFLRKFHKNIKLESTILDLYKENCIEEDVEYDELMERVYDGTTVAFINEKTNEMIVFNFTEEFPREVYESHKEGLVESLRDIDFRPIVNIGNSPYYEGIKDDVEFLYDKNNPYNRNRYAVYRKLQSEYNNDEYRKKKKIDSEFKDQDREKDFSDFMRREDYKSGISLKSIPTNMLNTAANGAINTGLNYLANRAMAKQNLKNSMELERLKSANTIDIERKKGEITRKNKRYELGISGISVPTLMKDSDVKKANEMQPYTMQVRLMAINNHNEFVQFMDFIIGIKVNLHLIKSEEMIINLQRTVDNKSSKLFNFIRWTTGEKSLFKDLLLGVNDTKLDVANKSRGSSPWWVTLKRLRETARARNLIFNTRGVIPQSTIAISQYEVDAIKERYGYDLANPQFGVRVMNALFLMCFIIVDEGTRTVNILYDGSKSYQTYALETLEREVTMSSNKIGKELTRMISR